MQAGTLQRLAAQRMGIVSSPHWPLCTLLMPLVTETIVPGGALDTYRLESERLEDVAEFRRLVNILADEHLPANETCP